MRKVIHVHQQEVKKNDPVQHPAIIVRTYKKSTHHRVVSVLGPMVIRHAAEPDACGARVWIETDAPVEADGVLIG